MAGSRSLQGLVNRCTTRQIAISPLASLVGNHAGRLGRMVWSYSMSFRRHSTLRLESLKAHICLDNSAPALIAPLLTATQQADQIQASSSMGMTYFVPDPATGQLPRFGMPDLDGGMDWMTNVAANPTFTAPAGLSYWSDWSDQLNPDSIVLIPAGTQVIFDATSTVKTIGVKGSLTFDPTTSTNLTVGTIFVYAGGNLTAKIPDPQVKMNVTFQGILNLTEDPGQTSIGLTAMVRDGGYRGGKRRVSLQPTDHGGHRGTDYDPSNQRH